MVERIKKAAKWLLAIQVALALVFVALATYTNVPTHVTSEDQAVFTEMGLLKPRDALSFEQQIAIIRKVQLDIFKRAPLGDGIPEYELREPADLMRFGQGLCFDRSRTFEKAFSFLGFETRHVYLMFKENTPLWRARFRRGHGRHAVTEVKTSKGWIFVDSNKPWVALTRQGEPVE